jgi:cytochrome c-type biogenesis protein CcmH/NrfG
MLAHAATCDYCGPLLRETVQDLGVAPSSEEIELAAASRLANPRQRRAFARQLAGEPPRRRWWPSIPKPVAWLAPAVALAGLAAFFIQTQWNGVAVAERLTNQAYTARRTLAMRFPGAAYAPPQGVEMGGETSRLNQPPELYDAEAKIRRGLEAHPDDPHWLRLQAETDLLQNRVQAAIAGLQRAHALRPEDPYILSDLGIAYYQKAQNGDDPYYAQAFQVISEGLRLRPKDPVLLFNQALAAGYLHAFSVERDAWEAYLQVEPKGGWADEARRRLAAVRTSLDSGPAPAPPQKP